MFVVSPYSRTWTWTLSPVVAVVRATPMMPRVLVTSAGVGVVTAASVETSAAGRRDDDVARGDRARGDQLVDALGEVGDGLAVGRVGRGDADDVAGVRAGRGRGADAGHGEQVAADDGGRRLAW
jgi:hypothetical protein